jgi:Peptidase family S41
MTDVRTVVRRINGWLGRLMPESDRIERLTASLEKEFGDRADPIDAAVCAEIERAAWAHSRHLMLAYEPDGTDPPDTESPGWPEEDLASVRRRAGGVSEVRRLPGGACLIRVDGLEPVAAALPYVDAAFQHARDATHLVLDLRANGGGDPATLTAIAGRLLGPEAQHLSDVVYRDRRRQWWTTPGPALTQDVAVLVSGNTYSSAEALVYHLQARGRVTVVGERTRGAADHITPIRLVPQVLAFVPEAYVVDAATGGNWEQTGVVPDVECTAAEAVNRWP